MNRNATRSTMMPQLPVTQEEILRNPVQAVYTFNGKECRITQNAGHSSGRKRMCAMLLWAMANHVTVTISPVSNEASD